MKIAILGTGVVGRTLASKLASLGHDVVIGTRDPAATRARPGAHGEAAFASFLAEHPSISLGTHADAARHGELVFNATSGTVSLQVLQLAGASNLEGKVLVDVSNPLDFSRGFPPSLSVCNDDSVGEQIQRTYPTTRVVKALNTVNANLMVNAAALAGADHTMLICGDDAGAKGRVVALLREDFGWQDILDLGGIAMARGLEMYLPLWVRLYGALQTPMFSIKVVR